MRDRPYQPRSGGRYETDPQTGTTRRVDPGDKGSSKPVAGETVASTEKPAPKRSVAQKRGRGKAAPSKGT